jgi:hypothetical protein
LAAGLFGFLRRTEISDWLILLVFAEVVLPVPGEVAGGAALNTVAATGELPSVPLRELQYVGVFAG